MNPLTIAGIFIALTSLVLIGILLRYGTTKLHRLWLAYNAAVGIWGLGCVLISLSRSEQAALLSWKIAVLGADLVPAIFYHFVVIFTKRKETKLVTIFYLFSFALLFTNYFGLGNPNVAVLNFLFNSFYFIQSASFLYSALLIAWIFIVLLGNLELFQYYRRCSPDEKNRTAYLFFGFLIGFSGALTNLLPHFGINLYPFGNFMIPLYSIIVVYAILKHQLLDIVVVIRKSIVYTILIGLVSLAYLATVFLFEKFLQESFGYRSPTLSFSAALILGTILIPLRNQIQCLVDKYFFQASMPELAYENTFLRQEVMDKEKFKAVATMASGMAHEIKNPLTAIKIFSEYLPLKMNDPEFLQKFSRIVGKEADRINDLVRQLLEFSRPSAPKLEETSIQNLIGEVLDFLSSQFLNCNIKIEKNFQLNGTLLRIDPNQFRQVFLNLFINAIEAMPKGGTLAIQTEDQRPKTENQNSKPYTLNPKPCIIITITDTGTGIPPETLKTLFEPFHTTKAKGTGLGLSITKNIIESHKGRIKVESNVGRGTKFVVELPILKKSDPVSR